MAHNINRNSVTGKDSFFSVKEKAWHGLGQIVDDYPTSEEAIIHAGLDYEVIKRDLFPKPIPSPLAWVGSSLCFHLSFSYQQHHSIIAPWI